MFDQIELVREFFDGLEAVDLKIVGMAATERCRFCGGPLHRGDYARKPRGGAIAASGEALAWRFSLCCGREGCRRRATPPSVRFLGRRVYLGAVVIVASAVALVVATARAIRRATGISARTTRRWVAWWRGPFVTSHVFVELCARMVPTPSRHTLPTSILERLGGSEVSRVSWLLGWLAPLTTMSLPDGSRFVRGAM
jgi:hypothetical protein